MVSAIEDGQVVETASFGICLVIPTMLNSSCSFTECVFCDEAPPRAGELPIDSSESDVFASNKEQVYRSFPMRMLEVS